MNYKKQLKSVGVLILTTLVFIANAQAQEKLFIPSHPQPRAPLFVALHGCLSDAAASEKSTRMSEFAEKYGFYVLYPEPSLGADSKGCFDFYTEASQRPGGGDAAMVVNRVHELLNTYDIDSKKVFVLGMSGGASLVSVLTSCYSDTFRGAAIHSGLPYGMASNWQSSLLIAQTGALPLMNRNTVCTPSDYKGKMFLIHGSRDQIMNPRHYFTLKQDYFTNMPTQKKIVAPQPSEYGYVREFFYRNNQLAGQGVFVIGMNHEWSGGGDPINPLGPRGPDVSKMMVQFFLEEN